MVAMLRFGVGLFINSAFGQQLGQTKLEQPMALPLQVCDSSGCQMQPANATMDANWRWLHDSSPGGYQNCYTGDGWDTSFCPDAESCAQNCAVEGIDKATYAETYGVKEIPGGLQLAFKTGDSVGSRLYAMDTPETYKLFYLKNREFSFDVDVSTLGCGLNGALYFVSMDQKGWKGMGYNNVGASRGVGYCDAQCPYDMKFVGGSANLGGNVGACCTELDIFEGNRKGQQMAVHPCDSEEPFGCVGAQCGDNKDHLHYKGACDKDGCDFNAWRMGIADLFGPNGEHIDSNRAFTVVTEFHTSDGTDNGELSEIRRYYLQDGRRFDNPMTTLGDSINDQFCADVKKAFPDSRSPGQPGAYDQFNAKGGSAQLSKALERGLVLVLSIWDDPASNMRWLDSDEPLGIDPTKAAGVRRGPCTSELTTDVIRTNNANAAVSYANIRYGTIGSTQESTGMASVMKKAEMPRPIAQVRRLPAAAPLVVSFSLLAFLAVVLSRRRPTRTCEASVRAREADIGPLRLLVEELEE